jgi:hypothetical protein
MRPKDGGAWARVLDSPQPHLLCLAQAPDGSIYAGSDGEGLVYRVSPDRKVSVAYDADPSEIHALAVGPDGAIYAASAASEGGTATPGKTALLRGPRPDTPAVRSRLTLERVAFQEAPIGPSRLKPGENLVLRIDPDGSVREISRAKALFYALAWRGDRLLVGSGPDGVLYEVRDQGREWSSLARIDHGQVLCLAGGPDGAIWLGAGDPGGVRRLEEAHAPSGSFESEVLDTRLVSRFGALTVEGARPRGTSVSVQARVGNVRVPDETWSDWSPPADVASPAAPGVPPGRFVQYRLTLSTSDPAASPEVRSVSWLYRSVNQAPEIGALTVPDLTRGDGSSRKPRFELAWEATDPNHDTLEFRLSVRKEGWPSWVDIGGPAAISEKTYAWDTSTVPGGPYRLRVRASDRPSNPESEALERSRDSETFVVDHRPPSVALSERDGRVEVRLEDGLTRIASAEVAIDSGPWTPLFPEDGLFDSTVEQLRVPLGTPGSGPHVVVVRASDAAGNVGAGDILVVAP